MGCRFKIMKIKVSVIKYHQTKGHFIILHRLLRNIFVCHLISRTTEQDLTYLLGKKLKGNIK